MAVGNFVLLSKAALGLGQAKFNLGSDTFVCVLVAAAYTPNPNTDSLWSDVSANELPTAGGYTAGGVVLGAEAWSLVTATATFATESAIWTTATLTAKYAVVVRRAGASLVPGDLLLGYLDLNNTSGSSTVSSTAGTFAVNWNNASTASVASTLFTLTHTP